MENLVINKASVLGSGPHTPTPTNLFWEYTSSPPRRSIALTYGTLCGYDINDRTRRFFCVCIVKGVWKHLRLFLGSGKLFVEILPAMWLRVLKTSQFRVCVPRAHVYRFLSRRERLQCQFTVLAFFDSWVNSLSVQSPRTFV